MKTLLTILVVCSLSTLKGFGQINTLDPVYFYCNGQLYSTDYGAWSDPIQSCDKYNYRFYSNDENFNDIPFNDSIAIEKIKIALMNRSGKDFYNRLILQNVIISNAPQKCEGRKYTLRYIFPLDTVFYYRFSLTYDIKGKLLSEHKFPDVQTNKSLLTFIDYCKAIEIALLDTTFKKAYEVSRTETSITNETTGKKEIIGKLSRIELVYDKQKNIWTWQIFTETVFDGVRNKKQGCLTGYWTGKKIILNAHSSEILSITDFKEFKSVMYSR
jgi:hypothetical protein